jgi:hypothetical protein
MTLINKDNCTTSQGCSRGGYASPTLLPGDTIGVILTDASQTYKCSRPPKCRILLANNKNISVVIPRLPWQQKGRSHAAPPPARPLAVSGALDGCVPPNLVAPMKSVVTTCKKKKKKKTGCSTSNHSKKSDVFSLSRDTCQLLARLP